MNLVIFKGRSNFKSSLTAKYTNLQITPSEWTFTPIIGEITVTPCNTASYFWITWPKSVLWYLKHNNKRYVTNISTETYTVDDCAQHNVQSNLHKSNFIIVFTQPNFYHFNFVKDRLFMFRLVIQKILIRRNIHKAFSVFKIFQIKICFIRRNSSLK